MEKIINHYQRIAHGYDEAALLPQLMGERLLDKLDFIKISPSVILDLGAGTGALIKPLKKRFNKANIIGMDLSFAMLGQAKKKQGWFNKSPLVAGDMHHLPLQNHSVDLIVMNCVLPWSDDLLTVFNEIARVLKPEGLLLFASLGPDTLQQLKSAWREIDELDHVNRFIDMHDIGDMLLHTGFADPVMDMEKVTIHFASLKQMLKELKYIGSINFNDNKPRGLQSKNLLNQLSSHYPTQDGKYPATAEIVYGHAWGKALSKTAPLRDGQVSISLDKILYRMK